MRNVRSLVVAGLLVAAVGALLAFAGGWRLPNAAEAPALLATFHPTSEGVENGPILFLGGRSFMTVLPDGTQTILPIGSHSRSCPTYSPDRRTFAFLRNGLGRPDGQLALADADGTDVRARWTGRFNEQTFHQVIWSADGSTVVGTRAVDSNRGVLAYARPREGVSFNVSLGAGEFPGTISLSPDGRRIATLRFGAAGRTDEQGIDILNVATGARTSIVSVGDFAALAWSPTGETVAYARQDPEGGLSSVRFVRPDGTDDRLVSTEFPDSGEFSYMAWSRDGSRLAVLEQHVESDFFVQLFDATGRSVDRLGPFTSGGNLSFTWAPDGGSIVLTTGGGSDGLAELPLVAGLDGTSKVLEVPNGYYTQCPLGWAPAID